MTQQQLYIPTPEATASSLRYEDLYPKRFTQPQTYIRFSSTVEDMIGCPYCMTGEDAAFLRAYNANKDEASQCSENDFEEVMNFFEETSHSKQPYASVDNTPVLSFEELEAEYDETIGESARRFAKDIYSHWKNQRMLKNNRPLISNLKFEMNLETDDNDPYVCFRRREVRQARKTRGRDAQVTEKLKKLRKELEEARYLMAQVRRRELLARDQIALDKQIFEQRCGLKDITRRLNIKDNNEELLINQKVCILLLTAAYSPLTSLQPTPKPKPRVDTHAVRQGIPGMSSKTQVSRPDGRLVDTDLVYLEDQLAKRQEAIERFIDDNVERHQKWNIGWIDNTWRPITPPLEQPHSHSSFRAVVAGPQLITPPASASEEGTGDAMEVDQPSKELMPHNAARIRYASPPLDIPYEDQTRFRRRIGRGGRLMIDRRGVKRQKVGPIDEDVDDRLADRYRFEDDSSDEEAIYPVDWTDDINIRYRILIDKQERDLQRQQAQRRVALENNNRSASGHLMPPTAAATG